MKKAKYKKGDTICFDVGGIEFSGIIIEDPELSYNYFVEMPYGWKIGVPEKDAYPTSSYP